MDFRQEYKNSAEIMNPSAEAMERMKRNILEKAARPEKKVFPFKKLAYAGSALAACAVIAVAAANVMPSLTAKNEMACDAANDDSAVYAIADYDKTAGAESISVAQDADYSEQCDGGASESTATFVPQTTTAATTYNEPKNDSFADHISDSIFENNMTEAAEDDYVADAPHDEGGYVASTTHVHTITTLEMSADRSQCMIGATEYLLIPPERLTQLVFPDKETLIEYKSPDGKTYTVLDHGDFITVLCDGEHFGIYCTPEKYDTVADPVAPHITVDPTGDDITAAPDPDEG